MHRRLNPALALGLLLGLFSTPLPTMGVPAVTAQSASDAETVFSGSLYACMDTQPIECGEAVPDAEVFMATPHTGNVVFATTDSSGEVQFDLGRFAFERPSPVVFGVILESYPNGEIVDYDIGCEVNGAALPFEVAEGEVAPGGPTLEVQFEATVGDDVNCRLGLISGTAGDVPTESPETVTGELTGLGLTFEEFQAIYGEGEQIHPVDSLWEYPNPDLEGFTLLASFPDGLTGHIEFGYEEADLGGLPRADVAGQVEGALPSDASLAEAYVLSAPNAGEPTMRVERYESALLAEVAGGRTGIMLAYQEQLAEGGSVVTRATVTMPTLNDGTREATGDPGGPGLTQDEWEAVYGAGTVSQSGVVYENVTFSDPGSEVTVRYTGVDSTIGGLVFEFGEGSQLGGAAPEDVLTQQLDSVPADAVYQGSYYLPPTPEGPVGLIIDRWESESLAEIDGGSGSIIVVTQQLRAQQNPGSPPQLVVPQMDIVIAN